MGKVIITVLGKDTVGIIAKVCTYLAASNINILDINQTIVQDYFNMMMIADMSGIEKQPVIFPDAESIRRVKENRAEFSEPPAKSYSHGPEYLDKEGRRAMIGGALSAMLLIGGLLAAGFAAVILILGHLH